MKTSPYLIALIMISFLTFRISGYTQSPVSIVAGQTIVADTLYKIIRADLGDSMIKVRWMGGSNYEQHNYELDADQDGNTDFTFQVYDNASVGAGNAWAAIVPAAGARVAGVLPDSAPPCNGNYAARLSQGDTIAAGERWSAAKAYFYFTGWFPTSGYSCGPWYNQFEQYAGLSMVSRGDTVYGWVRMTVNLYSIYLALTLHEYAFLVRNTVGIPAHEAGMVKIWPNPARDFIRVSTTNPGGTATIFDLRGSVVWEGQLLNPQTGIALPGLPKGVYMVRYLMGREVWKGRVVVD